MQLHNFNEAVADCSAALALLDAGVGPSDPGTALRAKVTLRRGVALLGCELFERAEVDLVAADRLLADTGFVDLQASARSKLRYVCWPSPVAV